MLEIAWSAAASAEVARIASWHDGHSSINGAAVIEVIGAEIERLAQLPMSAPVYKPVPRIRIRTVQRLKYLICYEIRGNELRIVAVAHQRRRPGYWIDRLAE